MITSPIVHLVVNQLAFSLRELRHQRQVTALCAASALLAASYLLFLGELGVLLHREQARALEATVPTEVVLSIDGGAEPFPFDDARLAALTALPGVAAASPKVELRVLVAAADRSVPVLLDGRLAGDDPAHRRTRLVRGRGFVADDAREAVLPRALEQRLGGDVDRVELRLTRVVGGEEQRVDLPLRVVGVTSSDEVDRLDVPIGLALALDRYLRGVDVAGIAAARRGEASVRAMVVADSLAALPELVSTLRGLGYRTLDRLAEYEAVRGFARMLVRAVALLGACGVILAAATVFLSTLQRIRSRMREIALLRIHAVPTAQVVGGYAAQGIALGGLAFAGALALHVVLVGAVLTRLAEVLGVAAAPTAPTGWLLGVVAAVVVGASLIAAALAAWVACRGRSPAEALRADR